jgi:hypothetical protein
LSIVPDDPKLASLRLSLPLFEIRQGQTIEAEVDAVNVSDPVVTMTVLA